jgi:hypothetical protein
MGKTTFLDMWRKYLQQKGFPVLFFNAWETDFTGDPLVSFIGEMAIQMESIGGNKSKANEYLSKAKDLAATRAPIRPVPHAGVLCRLAYLVGAQADQPRGRLAGRVI